MLVTPSRSLRVENPARQRDIHRKVRERAQTERNSHTRFNQSYQSINAYTGNTSADLLIPQILQLIEDTPGDDGDDPERSQAIERYRKKGMERCVNAEPFYGELLNLFAVQNPATARSPSRRRRQFRNRRRRFPVRLEKRLSSAAIIKTRVEPVNTSSSMLPQVPTWPLAGLVVGLKLRLQM